MNDKAIEFEAVKFKTEKIIKQMKEANLNVTKYEEIYHKIINNCNNVNKSIPDSINSNTSFAVNYLETNYNKAIKDLELLLIELSKYEVYIQVSAFAKYLKAFINNPNKTNNDFILYRDSLIDILNKLLKSGTLDYDVEGNIIEEIYQITYYFIKEELTFIGTSETLNSLINNRIHINYLDKQISKELETINLNNPKYESLLKAKKEIDAKGINSNYVNEKFLKHLISYKLDYQKIAELIDSLIVKANDNIHELDNLEGKLNTIDSEQKDNYNKKKLKRNLRKNIILFITSGSIIAGLVFGSIKLSKERKYNTTIKIYTSKNEITSQTGYDFENENSVTIYELTPYEKKTHSYDDYSRTKTKYSIPEIDNLPIEEYLNLDLASLGIEGAKTNERKSELNLGDLYDETIRYVRQIEVNKNDYQDGTNPLALSGVILVSLLIEMLMEVIFIKTKFSDNKSIIALISAIKSISHDIKCLKEDKDNKSNNLKEIASINEKCHKLLLENKNIIKKLLRYYEIIKDNPEYHKENEEIEKTLKLIRKKENN